MLNSPKLQLKANNIFLHQEFQVFVDKDGNEYLCLGIPQDIPGKPICLIFQQVERKGGVIQLVGTVLEVYDEDMINIQLDMGEKSLFSSSVEKVEMFTEK